MHHETVGTNTPATLLVRHTSVPTADTVTVTDTVTAPYCTVLHTVLCHRQVPEGVTVPDPTTAAGEAYRRGGDYGCCLELTHNHGTEDDADFS